VKEINEGTLVADDVR
jgi:hypothetical protein